jgi:hypothetical protein
VPSHRDELINIEHIKTLKARYFRLMDARDWEHWSDVFTEDCEMILEGDPPVILTGREAIVDSARRNLESRVGMHLGHMPEISIDSETAASGRWTLLACSRPAPAASADDPAPRMVSFGNYVDGYSRGDDGAWRITTTRLSTVLRIQGGGRAGDIILGPTGGIVSDRL